MNPRCGSWSSRANWTIFGRPNKRVLDTMPKPKPKADSDSSRRSGRRGKRHRKAHVIYAIEEALGLNHSNIADLATGGYLSVDQIAAILHNPNCPGVASDVKFQHVAKMITGEYPDLWNKVRNRLAFRLGISVASMDEYPVALLRDWSGRIFSKDTVRDRINELRKSIDDDLKKGFLVSPNEVALRLIDKVTIVR